MKILVIPYSYPNKFNKQSAPFCRDQALALKTIGNDVYVLAIVMVSLKSIWNTKKNPFGFTQFNDSGLMTYVVYVPSIPKLRWLNNVIRTHVGINTYNRKIKNIFSPDIIHVHSFLVGDIANKIKNQTGIPYIITEHSSSFARGLLTRSQEKQAFRVFVNSKKRFAVSLAFAKLLSDKFDLSFEFVPNVIKIPEIVVNIKKNNLNKIKICSVGSLDFNKRQDRLINAIFSLKKEFSYKLELHIVGDGPRLCELENLVKLLELDDCVYFYGSISREQVFNVMKSADVFALSSQYETFGLVIIEALSLGLPVVATKSGGPESIIIDKKLGILTENNDIDFNKGLLKLLNNYIRNYYNEKEIISYMRSQFSFETVGLILTNKIRTVISDTYDPR